jgi:predicted nucleotidyltransferase component of viral defense system
MRLEQLLKTTARRLAIPYETVLKDYAIGHLLLAIAHDPVAADSLVMKGGTALKKLYFGEYRFSGDLDFSAESGPRGAALEEALRAVANRAQGTLLARGPFEVSVERTVHRDPHPHGQENFAFRIQFPWQRRPLCLVKLEVTVDEPILLSATVRPIIHGYGEELTGAVRACSLEEIVAEKLRALLQNEARRGVRGWVRPRCRDFYDLWRILGDPPAGIDRAAVRRILPAKCSVRGVSFGSAADFFPAALLETVRTGWDGDLAPLVLDLPAADLVVADLRREVEALLQEP